MKALVKDKPTRGATLTDRPIPKIGDNDLLVKVHADAVCGADIHRHQDKGRDRDW